MKIKDLYHKAICCICAILYISVANGQVQQFTIGDLVEITLNDANFFKGYVTSSNTETITINTQSLGEINVPISSIASLVIIADQDSETKGFPSDVYNSTRYFVNPSGYGLQKGQAYYENIAIFFNSVTFGITDNFSISTGGEIASILFAGRVPILFVSPKFSIPFGSEEGAFSLGGTLFTAPQEDFTGFGIIQSAITIGSRNNNLSVGSGIGFSTSDGFNEVVMPFNLSFMTRISQKISIVSDNFVVAFSDFEDYFGFFSAGMRLHFKKPGAAFNAGIWRPTEDTGELIAFPFVSASIPIH